MPRSCSCPIICSHCRYATGWKAASSGPSRLRCSWHLQATSNLKAPTYRDDMMRAEYVCLVVLVDTEAQGMGNPKHTPDTLCCSTLAYVAGLTLRDNVHCEQTSSCMQTGNSGESEGAAHMLSRRSLQRVSIVPLINKSGGTQ